MNKPNIAKRNARATERWVNDEGPTWPVELYELGLDAVFALNMVPGQEIYLKNPAFAAMIERPVKAFQEAHATFVARGTMMPRLETNEPVSSLETYGYGTLGHRDSPSRSSRWPT